MILNMMIEYKDGRNISTTVKLLANTRTEIDYLKLVEYFNMFLKR